jgi:hypothetical protein
VPDVVPWLDADCEKAGAPIKVAFKATANTSKPAGFVMDKIFISILLEINAFN